MNLRLSKGHGMSMKPLVSIVIPVYNGEKYVDACMESMLKQSYENIEIIVVNDGSKDSSGALCDKYALADCRVKVVHQENKGLSGARNAGIAQATGEYIIFCDIDDIVTEHIIKDNVELALKYEAEVVMFCFWYFDVDQEKLIENAMEKLFVGSAEEYFHDYLIPTIDTEVFNAPWNKMIKRSVLEKNGLSFHQEYPIYEDIIFASELFNVAEKIVVNNNMYYKYFVRSSGSLITRFFEKYFDSVSFFHSNAMRYCEKYAENEQQIRRFNELYTKLVLTHLKQISCKEDMEQEKKYQLIGRICREEQFIIALKNTDLSSGKKRVMRRLITTGKCKTICKLYYILNKFQGN